MSTWETTAYYAFGVPVYAGLVAAEAWLMKKRRRGGISFAESYGNVGAGLGSIVVGLFLGPALIALYGWAYENFAVIHWEGAWVVWPIALVGADFGHYWHHRLDHRVAACWAIHGVHHQPEEMNFTVAMRHAWFSDLYSFPFYAPLPLLGVPASHFFVATTLLSVHALITHSAEYDFPGFGIFVTPRSHIVHHAKNARYVDKNFGAMLRVWDRMFGTHVEIDDGESPEWGTVRGYETHDGARSQWVLVRDLIGVVRGAKGWREKGRVLFGRPVAIGRAIAPPRSAEIPVGTKIYVGVQFVGTAVFSLYVFVLREQHSVGLRLGAAVGIILTLVTLGGLLDGRRGAWRWEVARVAGALVGLAVI